MSTTQAQKKREVEEQPLEGELLLAAVDALVKGGINKEVAVRVITLIARKDIPNVSIFY